MQDVQTIDPLGAFLRQTMFHRAPSPLADTRFDITLEAGLAVVATTRIFRNAEEQPIEATLTFPIPVQAALHEMTARIGERRLVARARARREARETYEAALDEGKAAVLHEELLRGVHMLSVGQIPSGAEVEVRAVWAMPMTAVGGAARLRVPLTVGDVYGDSGLADSDALIHDGENGVARLSVRATEGAVTLGGAPIGAEEVAVPLNRPIDLALTGWTPGPLKGRAADGRAVALSIAPHESQDQPLDVALLVDHSGSMVDIFAVDDRPVSKHDAVKAALTDAAIGLTAADAVDLWEFETHARRVGDAWADEHPVEALARRAAELSAPTGGTRIGLAVETAADGATSRDILLITDGKSWDLDVQKLARRERRICVVLLGEDSLEANVGHLAALTGGEIFICAGADLSATLAAALESLRSEVEPAPPIDGAPEIISRVLGGMSLTAEWGGDAEPAATPLSRAAAAVAAYLALPAMETEPAAALAEAEGLVSHLTSLVLVDDDGPAQDGLPAHRKVALPSPAASWMDCEQERGITPQASRTRMMMPATAAASYACLDAAAMSPPRRRLAISWSDRPDLLRKGDLSGLSADDAKFVNRIAADVDVRMLARALKLPPIVLALALIARREDDPDAKAFAARMLDGADMKEVESVSSFVGL